MASEVITIERPDTRDLDKARSAVVEKANQITICSHVDLEDAATFLRTVKSWQKAVTDKFEPMKKAANTAHKSACALEKEFLTPLGVAEGTVKTKIGEWDMEQRRLREIEQEKLREIARKQELVRLVEERDRLIEEAEKLEAMGDIASADEAVEMAAIVEQQPIQVVVAPVKSAPKVEGISMRTIWKARVVDANAIPRQWLLVDEQALQKYARSMNERAKGTVPGVEFYAEQSVASRSF